MSSELKSNPFALTVWPSLSPFFSETGLFSQHLLPEMENAFSIHTVLSQRLAVCKNLFFPLVKQKQECTSAGENEFTWRPKLWRKCAQMYICISANAFSILLAFSSWKLGRSTDSVFPALPFMKPKLSGLVIICPLEVFFCQEGLSQLTLS